MTPTEHTLVASNGAEASRTAEVRLCTASRPADSRLLGVVAAVLVAIAFGIVLFLAIQLAAATSVS